MCEKVNRIKLKKMYSVPKVFKEISFYDGLNVILGEKSEDNTNPKSKKTNGVGKSVCADFINFALLKGYDDTRLSKISFSDLDTNTTICLELEIGDKNVTIKRKIATYDSVSIEVNNIDHFFEKISDGIDFIETLVFNDKDNYIPFRKLISSVTREEKTNFNNILRYHSNTKIPNDPTPLLYMLNIDIDNLDQLNKIKKKYDKQVEVRSETKKSLVTSTGMNLAEIRAELNEKENNLKESSKVIQQLKSNEVYQIVENDIIKLEGMLKSLCDDRMVLKTQVRQIESLPKPEKINEKEIKDTYNFYKKGLGDYIVKSLEEVNEFKNVIEKYQDTLISQKLKNLKKELLEVEEKIRTTERQYNEKLKIIDTDDTSLSCLQSGITAYAKEQENFDTKKSLYNLYNKTTINIENIKADYANVTTEMLNNINDMNNFIESLEKTLSDFHFYVMGDRYCSLTIKMDPKISTKQVIDVETRITDDGSFSVDRIKVFLYDVSLMFNEYTRKNHPKFIIHDNIFHFDDDSTEKCLSLILDLEEKYSDFQYITTLNIDDFNTLSIKDKIASEKIIAKFTKTSKFLGKDYKEI